MKSTTVELTGHKNMVSQANLRRKEKDYTTGEKKVKVESRTGRPTRPELIQFLWHEATESIATPPSPHPGWNASPSQGYPQQYVAGTHLYTWVERDNIGLSFLSKETTRW